MILEDLLIMKASYVLLAASMMLSASSFVGSHPTIHTPADLFLNMQHLFGLVGGLGGVFAAWMARSPVNGNSPVLLSKITGNGNQKVPPTS